MAAKTSVQATNVSYKPRYHHRYPVLSGRFWYVNRKLILGRARMLSDRIELTGWNHKGRHKRILPLVHIVHMEYEASPRGGNLTIILDTEEALELYVDDAHLWRQSFENWLSYHVLASAKIMNEQDKAYSISG